MGSKVSNKNAREFWVEIEIGARGRRTILMVQTDLELDQSEPDYDAAMVKALADDVSQHVAASGYLDGARLVRNLK